MILDQVAELKANIKSEYELKINKLRQEMEDALASLSKVEETLSGGNGLSIVKQDVERHRRHTKLRLDGIVDKVPTVPKRMVAVLAQMNGDFQRLELFEKIRNDGTGVQTPDGTMSVAFAKLVKAGEIVIVRPLRGNYPAIYRKKSAVEEKPLFESPNVGSNAA